MTRWLETDSLSNQNISSALAIGAYTADADRLIICDVSVDQAAGNGDYVMYLTRQVAGAGSSYVILPKTTMTAASGETAISGQSGLISVRSGDVLTVYVDGLAGDTTTPDTIVRWFELAALRPATADRTIAVDVSGQVTTGALAAGAITAAAIATGAVGADALAADAGAEISDAVWDEALSGHVAAGSAGLALSASSSADPLATVVPGSYASGTAGYKLGMLDAATVVTVISPTDVDGNVTTVIGDIYLDAHNRALSWLGYGIWPPDLTSATVTAIVDDIIEIDCTVSVPSGAGQKVICEPTGTETAAISEGKHLFQVKAILSGQTEPVTLVNGYWTSLKKAVVAA